MAAAWLLIKNVCCGGRLLLSHGDFESATAASFCNDWMMPSWTDSALAKFESKKHIRGKISKCAALPLFKDRTIILGNTRRQSARKKQPAACQLQITND